MNPRGTVLSCLPVVNSRLYYDVIQCCAIYLADAHGLQGACEACDHVTLDQSLDMFGSQTLTKHLFFTNNFDFILHNTIVLGRSQSANLFLRAAGVLNLNKKKTKKTLTTIFVDAAQ